LGFCTIKIGSGFVVDDAVVVVVDTVVDAVVVGEAKSGSGAFVGVLNGLGA
jgi:hypothetical protein